MHMRTEKLFVMSFMVLKSPFLSSMCSYFVYSKSYYMIKHFLLQEWSKLLEMKKHCAWTRYHTKEHLVSSYFDSLWTPATWIW